MAQHHALRMSQLRLWRHAAVESTRADGQATQQAIEHDLLAALQVAQDETAALARIIATAGHDLRQPLQAAVLMIDRVRISADASTKVRLGQALAMLQRLGDELGELALNSDGTAGRLPFCRSFSLAGLLEPLVPAWTEHAAARGVALRVRASSLHVVSDPTMLSAILRNLVGNAIKFTPRGGGVLIGCRRRAGTVELQVLDNGPGIAPERMATIFKAFQHSDGREDFGLGLSIVKRTADALGHTLEVRTVLGRGSRFGVSVPLAM